MGYTIYKLSMSPGQQEECAALVEHEDPYGIGTDNTFLML